MIESWLLKLIQMYIFLKVFNTNESVIWTKAKDSCNTALPRFIFGGQNFLGEGVSLVDWGSLIISSEYTEVLKIKVPGGISLVSC